MSICGFRCRLLLFFGGGLYVCITAVMASFFNRYRLWGQAEASHAINRPHIYMRKCMYKHKTVNPLFVYECPRSSLLHFVWTKLFSYLPAEYYSTLLHVVLHQVHIYMYFCGIHIMCSLRCVCVYIYIDK